MIAVEERNAMRRIIQQRKREQTAAWIQEAKEQRTKYLPYAISLITMGFALLLFKVLVSIFSSGIYDGSVQKNSLIGPVEVSGKTLYKLKVTHNLNRVRNNWCRISMFLLDENKNYIAGAAKDLYYERDRDNSYKESNAAYSVVIEKPGTYYFTIVPKYSRNENPGRIVVNLSKVHLGTIYLKTVGITTIILGIILIFYLYSDRELTKYVPPMISDYSIGIFKKFAIALGVLIVLFLYTGFTYKGYAGSSSIHDAPSGMFNNNDTNYFGK